MPHPHKPSTRRVVFAVALAITLALLTLFWHVRFSFRPARWPPVDVERKDNERGHSLDLWEALVCGRCCMRCLVYSRCSL